MSFESVALAENRDRFLEALHIQGKSPQTIRSGTTR